MCITLAFTALAMATQLNRLITTINPIVDFPINIERTIKTINLGSIVKESHIPLKIVPTIPFFEANKPITNPNIRAKILEDNPTNKVSLVP